MSEQIDWSKAPEGATHYVPAPNDLHHPIWLKMDGKTVLNAGYIGHDHWAHTYARGSQPCTDLSNAIARPTTPSWSGEGLPPVGAVCKIIGGDSKWWSCSGFESGEIVTVRHSFKNSKGYDMVVVEGCDGGCLAVTVDCVAVMRTPEQIAADERERMANMLWQRYLQPILAPAKEAQVKAALGLIYDDFYRKP